MTTMISVKSVRNVYSAAKTAIENADSIVSKCEHGLVDCCVSLPGKVGIEDHSKFIHHAPRQSWKIRRR